ncbi:MAG: hypothetical protein HY554_19255, partial [Elusimicrobia bacterium]|nr:hypothetical protein [Elusimicrobiota bacterium]
PTWLADFGVASGTISDNVSDVSAPRRVFLRLKDVTAGKHLNPTTLIKFDVASADSAWSEIATTGDNWAYDFPAAQFVTGNAYSLEAYATDGPGNLDLTACPFVPASGDNDCRTGGPAAGQAKFQRYFNYDKSKPSVSITSPTVETPNYVGGNYGLKVMSGTSSDNSVSGTEAQVAKVEFTLQVNETEPAKRWQGNVSSEPWKAVAEDLWSTATPSGPPGDPWAVWIASNVAWFESDSYILKVRSIDNAGNVSNEQSRSFTVDRSTPTSRVSYPADLGVYASQVLTISGTAIDDTSTSTGASSGLTSSLGLAIYRASDGKHWNGVSWAAGPSSSMTVTIAAGTGEKTWSKSLPAAFYDTLTVARDTFTIHAWATDRVNNPSSAYANRESSLTVKSTFTFVSGASQVSVVWPASGGGLNGVSSMTINVDAVGTGITQIWATAISSDGAYFWTGSSWGATTPANPNLDPEAYGLWLSTDSQDAAGCAPATCGPDMVFATPRMEAGIKVLFTSTHTVKAPEWEDGKRYKVFGKARNTASQVAHSTTSGHFFVYDVSAPTLGAHAAVLSLSTSATTPSWAPAFTIASGTIVDNVADISSPRRVFLRVKDLTTSKYLNPSTLIKFDVSNEDAAWAENSLIVDEWSYEMPGAQFVTGNAYLLEAYATDGPGNAHVTACPFTPASGGGDCRTGSASDPKFKRYFNYDKGKPSVAITTPSVQTPNYVGGSYQLRIVSGSASDNSISGNESKVDRVEFALQLNASEPTQHWRQLGGWGGQWEAGVDELWSSASPSGPPSDPWAVWIASHIAWFESDTYVLKVRSIDKAGNVSNEASRSFYVDRATPTSKVTSPAHLGVFTSQVLSIAGTAIDDTSTSTGTSTGLTAGLGLAVTRESDGYHWNGAAWAPPPRSSMTVTLSPGTGEKTWSKSLPAAFYDTLTVARDTFTIFTWAADQVNNPSTAFANVESSFTAKSTFTFVSGYAVASVVWPPSGGGLNAVSSVTVNVDAVGSGITQIWYTAVSSDGAYFWTGSSWGATTPASPNLDPEAYGLWLSTDDAAPCAGGPCSPDMTFATPRAETGIRVSATGSTSLLAPAWVDGKKYKVFARARNTANQVAMSTTSGHFFIYDISPPTLNAYGSVVDVSTLSTSPSWYPSFAIASGTVLDNVSDVNSPRRVFLQVKDITTGKFLNPTTLIKFDISSEEAAWSEISTIADGWSYELQAAQFATGNRYWIKAYAQDGVGNVDTT